MQVSGHVTRERWVICLSIKSALILYEEHTHCKTCPLTGVCGCVFPLSCAFVYVAGMYVHACAYLCRWASSEASSVSVSTSAGDWTFSNADSQQTVQSPHGLCDFVIFSPQLSSAPACWHSEQILIYSTKHRLSYITAHPVVFWFLFFLGGGKSNRLK